jgi:hypothetical protein
VTISRQYHPTLGENLLIPPIILIEKQRLILRVAPRHPSPSPLIVLASGGKALGCSNRLRKNAAEKIPLGPIFTKSVEQPSLPFSEDVSKTQKGFASMSDNNLALILIWGMV